MKVNLLGLTFAVFALSTVYSGCAVVEQKAGGDSKVGSPGTTSIIQILAAKPKKKVSVDIDNGKCEATYEEQPDGTVKKGTLDVVKGKGNLAGQCLVEPNDYPISSVKVNEQEVHDVGPALFIFKGSCRYCYINSQREMTCIVYNVATCP